jgi:hypothetical protein
MPARLALAHAPKHLPAFLALALTLLCTQATVQAAEPPITIENVRIGFPLGMNEGQFKVGCWTPIWVDLKSGRDPFKGYLEIEVPDDDGTPTIVQREIDLPAREFRPNIVLYTRPGSRNSEFHVRVRRPNQRLVASVDPASGWLDAINRLVLTMGSTRGVSDVSTLSAFTPPQQNPTPELAVSAVRIPDGIPNRAEGFDAVDAIVLDTNNQELMDALSGGKGPAIIDWVKSGGHLVVAVASNWQQVKDSVLAPLLPAIPSGTFELRDRSVLETFANSKKFPAASIPVAKLELVDERTPVKLAETTSSPLIVRGSYGFGRVTVVGLNVDQKPFSDWDDKKIFWHKILDIRGRYVDTASLPTNTPGAFYRQDDSDLSSLLHMSLEKFPGVKLVPFGWVAFFVFLYILLIGPGDYLFLKKVVKRMELTWITFPTIVIAVSLLAYIAAYTIKGTDLKINKMDIVDINQPDGITRGASWFTLFSPQNRDYDVSLIPLRLDLPASQLAPKALPAGTTMDLSWYSAPESRFGGVSNRLGLGNSGYMYTPRGEAQSLDKVRVQIWSTKSFLGRWSSNTTTKVLDSDLRPFGSDRLAGTVTNRLSRPLKNAIIVYGSHVYEKLGTIEPGATISLDGAQNRFLNNWLADDESRSFTTVNTNPYVYPNNADDNLGNGISRASLARVMMFREAMGAKSTKTNVPLQFIDLTGQAALKRPMLIAEVDGPLAKLELGTVPSAPQIDQVSLVRVILPLGTEAAAAGAAAEKSPTPAKSEK